jgi:hypothetical protein
VSAKITLYSYAHLIDKVKIYAKKHNTSVSKLVTSFFEHVIQEGEKKAPSSPKITSKLTGILKKANIKESDYQDYLEKKYL